ncbi:RICIN domain-containing protein [Actinacidiphila bryophytorum]|uniref:RICIN domain-containing protein n=1 Tax=Actinacidiphila bryophytorum TaxID=1436133 RepID=UPI002176E441|nr:RICIN domain-containing protein [Actinacidiphila bryophytorum]UWE12240.1 RICIN domain-containing protein [Actinacidiphila bryophytorum]
MRKVIVTALAAGALAVGTALPSVAQAAEPGHVAAGTALSYGYFVNLDSGKCMDAGWSHDNGTTLVQYDCYAGATQVWHG